MNLKTEIDFDIKRFFQWWGRELSSFLPIQIRQKLSDNSGYVFLSVSEGDIQIDHLLNDQLSNTARLTLDESWPEKYQQLLAENPALDKAKYVLRLRPEQAIKKILFLPVAAKENLRDVIGFEMDRLTPFKVEQVYYTFKVLTKEQQGKIEVLLVVTPKETLDSLYQQLKIVNIPLSFIDYSGAANNFEQAFNPYNLLPEKYRPVESKMTKMAIWGLSFTAIALMTLVLIYPLWQQELEIQELRTQLKSLKKDTQLVQSYQLEIDQIVDETEQLIGLKNNAPSLTEIINLLSQVLDKETWLTHLKYNNEQIQIQGQSPTASALISILEASPSFSNARFVSPLTQDKRTGMERFQISMTVNSKQGDADE